MKYEDSLTYDKDPLHTKLWHIDLTVAKDESDPKSNWHRNRSLHFLGVTLEEVIDNARKRFPGCAIWKISHVGPITLPAA